MVERGCNVKNCAVFNTNPPLWLQLFAIVASMFLQVEPLCEFPSREFYNRGQLKTCSTLKCVNYPRLNLFWPKGIYMPLPLYVCDKPIMDDEVHVELV